MRSHALLPLLVVSALGLEVTLMHQLVEKHWAAQRAGDEQALADTLSEGVEFYINGQLTAKDFVGEQSVIARVAYADIRPVVAIAKLDDTAVMTVIDWSTTLKDTGEVQYMGPWQQKIRFNDQGQITGVWSICDTDNLSRFVGLASPPAFDPKAYMHIFLDAFQRADVQTIVDGFDPSLEMITRNGVEGVAKWHNHGFLEMLFRAAHLTGTLEGFASAGPRQAYAHILWTLNVGASGPVELRDAWFITYSPHGRMSQIESTCDTADLAAFYQAFGYDQVLIGQQAAQDAARLRAEGQGQGKGLGQNQEQGGGQEQEPQQGQGQEQKNGPELLAKMKKLREQGRMPGGVRTGSNLKQDL